ncbi:hypothetical protein VKT23_015565 [Stygiomarasmius scandens]|uniref:Gustatory receptor n=1 Tax=Marasmiellus scandens TaxID=2682957 RepID=A0ABR1J1U6_9AGAR
MSNSTLPNPYTPLAFLSPESAQSLRVATYLQMGAFGVFLSDICINLSSDYEILTKRKVGPPTIVYIISRVSTLVFEIMVSLLIGGATVDCKSMGIVIETAMFITKATTSLLSSLRVRAIYNGTPKVQRSFLLLWLINVAGDCLSFLVVRADQLPNVPIKMCYFVRIHRDLIAVAFFIRLLHDTLVFSAISYRLLTLSPVQERLEGGFNPKVTKIRDQIIEFFTGSNMPLFSKTLLKDGQLYYLVSTLSIVIVVVLVFVHAVEDNYLVFALTTYVAVFNSMACYVFRHVKLGRIREETISDSRPSTSHISGHFRMGLEHNPVSPFSVNLRRSEILSINEVKQNIASPEKALDIEKMQGSASSYGDHRSP